MASSSRVNWPALHFGPINLWVMPPWQRPAAQIAGRPVQVSRSVNGNGLHQTMRRLLNARGGGHA